MKRTRVIMGLSVALSFVLSGCVSAAEPQPVETRSLELSWADGATSRGQLIKQAEAIVVGTVESTEVVEVTEFGPLTDATIKVNTWAKDKGEKPETIIIRQTGGVADGVLYQAEDDPLLQVGEKGVFFVRHDENTGVYVVLGGPTGRLKVTGDEAQPLPGTSIQNVGNQKVDQVVRSVKGS